MDAIGRRFLRHDAAVPAGRQRLLHALGVTRIGLMEMAELALDDFLRHTRHRRRDVLEETLLLLGVQQAKQVARLRVVVVAIAVIVSRGVAADRQRRLGELRVLHRAPPKLFGS